MSLKIVRIGRFCGRRGIAAYAGATVAVVLGTLVFYSSPLILRFVLDNVLGAQDVPPRIAAFLGWIGGVDFYAKSLLACGGIYVVFRALEGFFNFIRGWLASYAAEETARRLRNRVYGHLNILPFDQKGFDTGDLIQRCTSDIEQIRLFIETQLVEVIRILAMLVLVVPYMLSINTTLTAVSLVLLPFIVIFSLLFFYKVKKYFTVTAEAEADMSTVLQETLSGVRVVKAFSQEESEKEKFEVHNREYREKNFGLIKIVSLYWGGSAMLCVLQIGLVVGVGVLLALGKLPGWSSEQLSVGDFSVFVIYVMELVWPIRLLGRILTELGKAFVSFGRLEEILALPVEGVGEEKGDCPEVIGSVEFRNAGVTYSDGTCALSEISFSAPAGSVVGVVGLTGSGKSTLVSLLPRLLEAVEGEVLVDGINIRDIDRNWLRKHTAMVRQEPFLYSRSISENISFGNNSAGGEQIEDAARLSEIHDTITGFNLGYDTAVGEKGVTLSGGQKQRLAIARALVANPKILILDDALSAIDAETDVKIRSHLRENRGSCTTFVVAHRLATVAGADVIVVLDKGRQVQCGTHDDLLKDQSGLYYRLWLSQIIQGGNHLDKEVAHD